MLYLEKKYLLNNLFTIQIFFDSKGSFLFLLIHFHFLNDQNLNFCSVILTVNTNVKNLTLLNSTIKLKEVQLIPL